VSADDAFVAIIFCGIHKKVEDVGMKAKRVLKFCFSCMFGFFKTAGTQTSSSSSSVEYHEDDSDYDDSESEEEDFESAEEEEQDGVEIEREEFTETSTAFSIGSDVAEMDSESVSTATYGLPPSAKTPPHTLIPILLKGSRLSKSDLSSLISSWSHIVSSKIGKRDIFNDVQLIVFNSVSSLSAILEAQINFSEDLDSGRMSLKYLVFENSAESYLILQVPSTITARIDMMSIISSTLTHQDGTKLDSAQNHNSPLSIVFNSNTLKALVKTTIFPFYFIPLYSFNFILCLISIFLNYFYISDSKSKVKVCSHSLWKNSYLMDSFL
jgi:hypothetical protein